MNLSALTTHLSLLIGNKIMTKKYFNSENELASYLERKMADDRLQDFYLEQPDCLISQSIEDDFSLFGGASNDFYSC